MFYSLPRNEKCSFHHLFFGPRNVLFPFLIHVSLNLQRGTFPFRLSQKNQNCSFKRPFHLGCYKEVKRTFNCKCLPRNIKDTKMPLRPLTLLYFALVIISLSGFGVLFLNEEAILAIAFWAFFALILKNSSGVSQALDEQVQSCHERLSSSLQGQGLSIKTGSLKRHFSRELNGFGNGSKKMDFKIKNFLK